MTEDQLIRLISDQMQKTHKPQMDTVIGFHKRFGSRHTGEMLAIMEVVKGAVDFMRDNEISYKDMIDKHLIADKVIQTGQIGLLLESAKLGAAVNLSGTKDVPDLLEYFTAVIKDDLIVTKETCRLREEFILQSN